MAIQRCCCYYPVKHRPHMDPRVWRALPTALVEKVLAHLPIVNSNLLRNQAVCQAWKSFLSSSYFRCMHTKVWSDKRHVGESYQLLGLNIGVPWGPKCITMYDFGTKRWLKLPTSCPPDLPHILVEATCGGLLCVSECNQLWICNPVTNRWRRLPPSIDNGRWVLDVYSGHSTIQLVMDVGNTTYKVVSLASNLQMVYHSSTDAWTTTHAVLPFSRSDYCAVSHQEAVTCGNFIYMKVEDNYKTPGIIAFDIKQGRCLVQDFHKIPGTVQSGVLGVRLVTYKDSLFVLVHELENSKVPKIRIPIPVVLRKYEPATHEFILIAKMPAHMAMLVTWGPRFEQACVTVHGDDLFMATPSALMRYNFIKGSWKRGKIRHSGGCRKLSEAPFCFKPNLSAQV